MIDLKETLLIIVGLEAVAVVLLYTLFAPWWTTRAGRAVFALYWAVLLIIAHFAAEAILGEGPEWREIGLLALVGAVIAWNGYTIVSKQIRARRNHEPGH